MYDQKSLQGNMLIDLLRITEYILHRVFLLLEIKANYAKCYYIKKTDILQPANHV